MLLLTDQRTSTNISTAKVGDKIQWIGSESDIEFEHFGIVLNNNDNKVTFQTVYGEMNIQHNDGKFAVNIAELPLIIKEVEIDNYKKEAKRPTLREGSKQQKVVEIMRNNPGLSRKEYMNINLI